MFRKFFADTLFTGHEMLQGKVLITDSEGVVQDLVPRADAGDDVEKWEGMLCPGLINCHCHLELSHLHGLIPRHTGLIDFVFAVFSQRHFMAAEIATAIEQAEEGMLQQGIVAVGDISNLSSTAPQKAKQRLAYYNLVEVAGWLPQLAESRLAKAKEVYDAFSAISAFSAGHTALVPHAPYSVSEDLWQLIPSFFQHKTVSIHNQETAFEDELFIQGSGDFTRMYRLMNIDHVPFVPPGKSSLQAYFSRLRGARNVLLVHNTFTREEDVVYAQSMAAAQDQQLFFCLCPNANLYIENTLPPLDMLLSRQATMVLGTDSLASNETLSILEEIKTLRHAFGKVVADSQLLQMATLNGARALDMSDKLGSFERGKQPGIVLIDARWDTITRLL